MKEVRVWTGVMEKCKERLAVSRIKLKTENTYLLICLDDMNHAHLVIETESSCDRFEMQLDASSSIGILRLVEDFQSSFKLECVHHRPIFRCIMALLPHCL